LIGGDIRKWWL